MADIEGTGAFTSTQRLTKSEVGAFVQAFSRMFGGRTPIERLVVRETEGDPRFVCITYPDERKLLDTLLYECPATEASGGS